MRKKIIKIARYGALLFPYIAFAQLDITAGGGTRLPQNSLFNIIRGIMMWLLGILGFVAVIGFVISGIMYLVAAGDEEVQGRAKRAMLYSITGVIVGMIGLIVLYAVYKMFIGQGQF